MKSHRWLALVLILVCLGNFELGIILGYPSTQPGVPEHGVETNFEAKYWPTVKPAIGPQRTVAILVEFPDLKHTQERNSIDSAIFVQLASYYAQVSYGQMQIVGTSVGWYRLPRDMAYYGTDMDPSIPGSDRRNVELVADAVVAAHNDVNFGEYDRVVVVHAGIGQEDAVQNSTLIWSEAYWSGLSLQTRDGTTIRAAAILPEMEAGQHSALGVYAHEYAHLLGLPDLYQFNLAREVPDPFVGRWSLMGTGVWLGDPRGSSPAEPDAWSRIKLGWLTPDMAEFITGNPTFQFFSLEPLEASVGTRAIKILPLGTDGNRYYMIEFRKKTGYDSFLPNEGVLVTRIDELRGSGEGIVRIVDSNPSTPTLDDAHYGAGATFNDIERHVFVKIIAIHSGYSTLLIGNTNSTGFNLTMTRIAAPLEIYATYSRATDFSVVLTNDSGEPLVGLTVRLQYYFNERWNDYSLAVTDKDGEAGFQENFKLKPGNYQLRFLFAGQSTGSRYLVGVDQVAKLSLRKISTSLQVQAPLVAHATENTRWVINAFDEFLQPIQNLDILVWLDGELLRKESLVNGTMSLTLNFGLHQIGKHVLKFELEGNPFYNGTMETTQMTVLAPDWFYVVGAVVVVAGFALTYLTVRLKSRFARM